MQKKWIEKAKPVPTTPQISMVRAPMTMEFFRIVRLVVDLKNVTYRSNVNPESLVRLAARVVSAGYKIYPTRSQTRSPMAAYSRNHRLPLE